ncbi:hypothetical protein FOL47_009282 [Perkinsus chesapeaki]|uniref:Uncharacterized protein n=1 Tax=Perkinsus chesapeaki TaxID=330153 RepID=A0A7J6L9J1_PERCH|nr:hypothetical protein FOL47_009282 [Perkinsus chesapeaki]
MTEAIETPRRVKPTEEQLVAAARTKVRNSKSLERCLAQHKSKLVELLGQCVKEITERLQRGEAIDPSRVDYPLMQATDNVLDLDDLPFRDFKQVDLRTDVVDDVLSKLSDGILRLCLDTIPIRNIRYHDAIQRQNQALLERMQTIEEALLERSRLLSRCRLAYYRELTHLRNQIYLKQQRQLRGHEETDDDVYEAYYFDPTEFLEEDLRMLLNDKIKMSVELWVRRFNNLKDLNAELESIIARDGLRKRLKNEVKEEPVSKRREPPPAVEELVRPPSLEEEIAALCDKYRPDEVLDGFSEIYPATVADHVQPRIDREVSEAVMGAIQAERDRLEYDFERRIEGERNQWAGKVAQLEAKNNSLSHELDEAKKQSHELRSQLTAAMTEGAAMKKGAAESARGEAQLRDTESKLEESKARCVAAEKSLSDALSEMKAKDEELVKLREVTDKARSELSAMVADKEALLKEVERLLKVEEEARRQPPVGGDDSIRKELEAEVGERMRQLDEVRAELDGREQEWSAERAELQAILTNERESAQRSKEEHLYEIESLNDSIATLRGNIKILERALADSALQQNEDGQQALKRKKTRVLIQDDGPLDDGSGTASQTCISGLAHDAGFFMVSEAPGELDGPSEAFKMELEELDLVARTIWEGYMDVLHAARRPPFGYGDGQTRVHRFTRLIKSVLDRLDRLEDLLEMITELIRNELLRVVAIIRMLQDSSYPDFVSKQGRNLLFGKGMSSLSRVTEASTLAALMQVEGSMKGNLVNLYKDLITAGSICPILELDFRPGRRSYVPIRATVHSAARYSPTHASRISTSAPQLQGPLDGKVSMPLLESEGTRGDEVAKDEAPLRLPTMRSRPQKVDKSPPGSPTVFPAWPGQYRSQQGKTANVPEGRATNDKPKVSNVTLWAECDGEEMQRPSTTSAIIRGTGVPSRRNHVLNNQRFVDSASTFGSLPEAGGDERPRTSAGQGVLRTPFTVISRSPSQNLPPRSGRSRRCLRSAGTGSSSAVTLSVSALRCRLQQLDRVATIPSHSSFHDQESSSWTLRPNPLPNPPPVTASSLWRHVTASPSSRHSSSNRSMDAGTGGILLESPGDFGSLDGFRP